MTKNLCKILVLAAVTMMIAPAHAADDKTSASKAQLRQVQQEKRKLEQDKAQLEQDKATLDAQLKQTAAMAEATKGKASRQVLALQKDLDQAKSDNAELTAKAGELQKQLDETQARLTVTLEQRHVLEVAKTQLETNVGERDQALSSCIVKNQKAYEAGQEILEKYQNKSCLTAMLEREPFFGVAQTRVENEVAGLREQLDRQHIAPQKPTAPVAQADSGSTQKQ